MPSCARWSLSVGTLAELTHTPKFLQAKADITLYLVGKGNKLWVSNWHTRAVGYCKCKTLHGLEKRRAPYFALFLTVIPTPIMTFITKILNGFFSTSILSHRNVFSSKNIRQRFVGLLFYCVKMLACNHNENSRIRQTEAEKCNLVRCTLTKISAELRLSEYIKIEEDEISSNFPLLGQENGTFCPIFCAIVSQFMPHVVCWHGKGRGTYKWTPSLKLCLTE